MRNWLAYQQSNFNVIISISTICIVNGGNHVLFQSIRESSGTISIAITDIKALFHDYYFIYLLTLFFLFMDGNNLGHRNELIIFCLAYSQ